MVSLSILICTIGRPQLEQMLESLVPQLNQDDNLYIAIDGFQYFDDAERIISSMSSKFNCNLIVLKHPTNLGAWGHGLRNFYQGKLAGDYILHADDDDIYVDCAMDIVRKNIKKVGDLYIFQMCLKYCHDKIVPSSDKIVQNGIGTPNGVVPNVPEKFGYWTHRVGGDYDFWKKTSLCFPPNQIHFIKEVIYHANAHGH